MNYESSFVIESVTSIFDSLCLCVFVVKK